MIRVDRRSCRPVTALALGRAGAGLEEVTGAAGHVCVCPTGQVVWSTACISDLFIRAPGHLDRSERVADLAYVLGRQLDRSGAEVLAQEPGVLRVAFGWSLVMLAHFVVLTYIEPYLAALGLAPDVTSISLSLIGVGGIVGTLPVGRFSRRFVFAALAVSPGVAAAGFTVLLLRNPKLAVVLTGVGLWGIGLAATVVVYQQAILVTGHKAPKTATSVGVSPRPARRRSDRGLPSAPPGGRSADGVLRCSGDRI